MDFNIENMIEMFQAPFTQNNFILDKNFNVSTLVQITLFDINLLRKQLEKIEWSNKRDDDIDYRNVKYYLKDTFKDYKDLLKHQEMWLKKGYIVGILSWYDSEGFLVDRESSDITVTTPDISMELHSYIEYLNSIK